MGIDIIFTMAIGGVVVKTAKKGALAKKTHIIMKNVIVSMENPKPELNADQ
jgi:hypothetical protein